MHDVETELRVAVESLLEQRGIAETRAEAATAGIERDAWRARAR